MIKYVSAVVPKEVRKNLKELNFKEEFRERFVESTGIRERRVSKHRTEELMVEAFKRLNVSKDEFECIVTVTQTPTYQMPGAGYLVGQMIGMDHMVSIDLNAACDGYIKGLQIAEGLAEGSGKPVLLLVGDTLGSFMPKDNPSVSLVFGNAASATLVSPDPDPIHKGGFVKGFPQRRDALTARDYVPFMNGEAVTVFATREVPAFMKEQNLFGDIYYFHQANKMILSAIEKRLGIDPKLCPQTFEYFGNTSSASIPLTMCVHPPMDSEISMVLCGFGAGLSISGCIRTKPEATVFDEVP